MADKFVLCVTAGSNYDNAKSTVVPVNRPEPIKISSDGADVDLNVRIQGYNGLPRDSASTSKYFDREPHKYNQDQYSISIRFTPKKPATTETTAQGGNAKGISGTDLQFGNDFDHPIRDKLPPGFNTAMNIVKWWIDPGLEGDAYADRPHLYGPALSSFNHIHVGGGEFDEEKGGLWIEEGGDAQARTDMGAPSDSKARMKWALGQAAKDGWTFEYGKTYGFDFFNPYLDFANLSLKLPGFHISVAKYWDGQGLRKSGHRSHDLRYVLRHRQTGETYLVILVSLYLKEDINEDGSVKEGAERRATESTGNTYHEDDHDINEETMMKEAQKKFGDSPAAQTSADDVD